MTREVDRPSDILAALDLSAISRPSPPRISRRCYADFCRSCNSYPAAASVLSQRFSAGLIESQAKQHADNARIARRRVRYGLPFECAQQQECHREQNVQLRIAKLHRTYLTSGHQAYQTQTAALASRPTHMICMKSCTVSPKIFPLFSFATNKRNLRPYNLWKTRRKTRSSGRRRYR